MSKTFISEAGIRDFSRGVPGWNPHIVVRDGQSRVIIDPAKDALTIHTSGHGLNIKYTAVIDPSRHPFDASADKLRDGLKKAKVVAPGDRSTGEIYDINYTDEQEKKYVIRINDNQRFDLDRVLSA